MFSAFRRAGAKSSANDVKRDADESSSRQESESQEDEEDSDDDEEDDELEEDDEEKSGVLKFVKIEAEESSDEEDEEEGEEEEEEEEEDSDSDSDDEDEEGNDSSEEDGESSSGDKEQDVPVTKNAVAKKQQANKRVAAATKKQAAVSTTTSSDSDSEDSGDSDSSSEGTSSSEDDSDDSDEADEETKEAAKSSSLQNAADATKASPRKVTKSKAPVPADEDDEDSDGEDDDDEEEDSDNSDESSEDAEEKVPTKSQEGLKEVPEPVADLASPKLATAELAGKSVSPKKKVSAATRTAAAKISLSQSQSDNDARDASQSSYDLPQQPIAADEMTSSSDDDLEEIPNVWPPVGMEKYLNAHKDKKAEGEAQNEVGNDSADPAAQLELESQAIAPHTSQAVDLPEAASRLPNLTEAKKRGGRRQVSKPTFVEQVLLEATPSQQNKSVEAHTPKPAEQPAAASSSQASSRRRNTRKVVATPASEAPEPLQEEPVQQLPEPIPEEQLQEEQEQEEEEQEEEEQGEEEQGEEEQGEEEQGEEEQGEEEQEEEEPSSSEEPEENDDEEAAPAPEPEDEPESEPPAPKRSASRRQVSKHPAPEVPVPDPAESESPMPELPATPSMNSELNKTPRTKSTARRSLPAPGIFTDMELHRLRQAASTYRDLNDMDVRTFNDSVQDVAKSHKDLWNHMAEVCPDRPRIKVILRCRRLFNNFDNPYKWKPEQDAELKELVAKYGHKWKEIGGLINRSQEDVRKRWEEAVVYDDKPQMFYWTFDEEKSLGTIVGQILRDIQHSRGLNVETIDRDAELNIPWQQVSDRMGFKRTARQCRIKWFQIREAYHFDNGGDFVGPPEPVAPTWSQKRAAKIQGVTAIGQPLLGLGKTEDGLHVPGTGRKISDKARAQMRKMQPADKYRLVKSIRASHAGSDRFIPWHRLVNAEFRAKWNRATRELMWNRLRLTVPRNMRLSVRDVADYLIKDFEKNEQLGDGWDIDFGDKAELNELTDEEEADYGPEPIPTDGSAANGDLNSDLSDLPSSLSRTPAAQAGAKRKAKSAANGRRALPDRGRKTPAKQQHAEEEQEEGDAGEAAQEMDLEKHVSESEHEEERSSKRRRKTFATSTNGRGRNGNGRTARTNGKITADSEEEQEAEKEGQMLNQNGKRPAENDDIEDIEDIEEPVEEEDEDLETRGNREASVVLGQRTPTPPPLTQSLSPSMAKDKPVLARKLKQRQQNGDGEDADGGGGLLSAAAERFGTLSAKDKSGRRRLKRRALRGSFVDEIEDVEESPVRPRPAKRRR